MLAVTKLLTDAVNARYASIPLNTMRQVVGLSQVLHKVSLAFPFEDQELPAYIHDVALLLQDFDKLKDCVKLTAAFDGFLPRWRSDGPAGPLSKSEAALIKAAVQRQNAGPKSICLRSGASSHRRVCQIVCGAFGDWQ